MVTVERTIGYTPDGKPIFSFRGTSNDTKPTDVGNGSDWIEMDTSTLYFFDEDADTWQAWGGN